MSDSPRENPDDPESTIDAQIAELLDEYLEGRRRGTAPDRHEWLAAHPEHAERLSECLDAADLFGDLNPGGFDLSERPETPESIGDFEIRRELGRGGMGVVYEAREKSLDRIVALKVMRFGIVDPKALDRFRREAETAGALHHTNIVPVYATGREGDTSWYAMQRIDGESLAGRLGRAKTTGDRVGLDEILDVGIQAAEALSHAHERDVIHRDVKPANLILDNEHRVWLTDFGLARRLVDVGATVTGTLLGTPRYMSPEQADLHSSDVDHRSDIYSLGATLYEMATGRPPVDGDDPFEVISKIRHEDPPLIGSIRSDLPKDLEVVLAMSMEKDPDRRYQSARAFADDLRAIRDDHPVHARPLSVFERVARFTRKHQGGVRVAVAAATATIVLFTAALYGFDHWRAGQLGSFRIRAGGGPYQATITPSERDDSDEEPLEMTLPMQQHHQLPLGDYDMQVAPRGRWSRSLRLPVTAGLPSEYRLTPAIDATKEIDVRSAVVETVGGDEGDTVLWRRSGRLRKVAWSDDDQWQRDVSSVATRLTPVDEPEPPSQPESTVEMIDVDFANTDLSANYDRGQFFLDDNPLLTLGTLALRTRIDLDGDDRSDSIVAAVDRQALLALDHSGKTLWARTYSFAGLPDRTTLADPYNSRSPIPFPGVFDLRDVGDIDGDQTPDLLAMLVHFRMSVRTDVCLLTLSGKTGEPIRSTTLNYSATNNQLWPADGIFHPDRYQYRPYDYMSATESLFRRTSHRSLGDFHVRQRAQGSPIQIAVPSPPTLINRDDQTEFALLVGDRCHLFSMDQMRPSGVTIQLPYTPARAPVVAQTEEGPRLVFHSIDLTRTARQSWDATDISAYDLQGQQAWTYRAKHQSWNQSVGSNHADWPSVVDVDQDGVDEILVPRSRYRNGIENGVMLLDGSSGRPRWRPNTPYSSLQSADYCLARMVPTVDLDGDGFREIAIASFSGKAPRSATQPLSMGELYLYLDWVSGKTGSPIAWARHRIEILSETLRSVRADAIRTGLPGQPSNTIEVDLIWGDQSLDAMHASAVVRFRPDQNSPVAIADGLDLCASPSQSKSEVQAKSPSQAKSEVRAFRRRGGPYGVGDDDLLLMRESDLPTTRLGESELLAAWPKADGTPVVAAQGFDPTRISVINGSDGSTMWSSDRSDSRNVRWIPIHRHDSTIDFLAQSHSGHEVPPRLIDGDSGIEIATLSAPAGGQIVFSQVLSDGNSMLLVGDGRLQPSPNQLTTNRQPVNAFRMSMVSLSTGSVRWSRNFLFGAARHNYPNTYEHLKLVDLNHDGVDDIVGSHSHDEQLFLAAWDGTDGRPMWERSVYQRPTQTNYWIPFSVIQAKTKPQIAFLAKPSADARERELLVCDPDGAVVATQSLEDRVANYLVARQTSERYLVIGDASVPGGQPMIAIASPPTGRYHCMIFRLDDRSLSEVASYESTDVSTSPVGMWFRDVNGDGVNERLVIQHRSDDGKVSLLLECFPMQDSDPIFQTEIPDFGSLIAVRWKQDFGVTVSWLHIGQNRCIGIDWRDGSVVADTVGGTDPLENVPRLCKDTAGTTRIAVPTVDGIDFLNGPAADGLAPASFVGLSQNQDPRRERALFDVIGGDHTITESLQMMARSAFAFAILIVVPWEYVRRMVGMRRWSLSRMLFAPVVVGLWIVVWKSDWVSEPGFVFNLLAGFSTWLSGAALYLALRGWYDRSGLAVRLMLLVGTPVLFVLMVGFALAARRDPSLRYTFGTPDLLRVALLSFCLVAQIYWLLRLPASTMVWLGKRIGVRQ